MEFMLQNYDIKSEAERSNVYYPYTNNDRVEVVLLPGRTEPFAKGNVN